MIATTMPSTPPVFSPPGGSGAAGGNTGGEDGGRRARGARTVIPMGETPRAVATRDAIST